MQGPQEKGSPSVAGSKAACTWWPPGRTPERPRLVIRSPMWPLGAFGQPIAQAAARPHARRPTQTHDGQGGAKSFVALGNPRRSMRPSGLAT